LKTPEANALWANLAAAGVAAEGAAGSMIQKITKFECTIVPSEIKQKTGGGADCSFTTGQ
jgi:hypothetical protein